MAKKLSQTIKDLKRELIKEVQKEYRELIPELKETAAKYIKSDSGELLDSLDGEINGLSLSFGSGLEYAKYLEYGTSKMPARPFLAPTLAEKKDEIIQRLNNALGRALKKAASK